MVSCHVVYAAVPISVIVALGLIRKWRSRNWAKCTSNTCLRGKTFLITGANSGIGYETAKSLIRRKARVIFACRDITKAKEAIAEIRKEQPNGGELVSIFISEICLVHLLGLLQWLLLLCKLLQYIFNIHIFNEA